MKKSTTYSYKENTEYPETMNKFLKYLASNKKESENTVKKYACNLKQFLKYVSIKKKWVKEKDYSKLDKVDISQITTEQIQLINLDNIEDYIEYCSTELENAESTLNNKISSLDTFYRYLVHKRIVKANIIEGVERPELPTRVMDYLTLEEAKRLLNTIKSSKTDFVIRDYCLFSLYINIGARLSELANAKIDKVDLINRKITLLGKGNKEREVKLNDSCIKVLADYIEFRNEYIEKNKKRIKDKDALFISEHGNSIRSNTISTTLKKYAELAGLDVDKVHVHALRHTSATLMYKHGKVDIRSLQKILGHSDISTTQIYTHVDEEQLQDAINSHPLAQLG